MKRTFKRTLCLLLALVLLFAVAPDYTLPAAAAGGDVAIDIGHFPDENFRAYVRQLDTDGDGVLSAAEIAEVIEIWCLNSKITSLKGVEYFTALKELSCQGNQLTTLDVSKNTALIGLNCSGNQLTALDVSKNTALISLNCSGNQLTALDVSKNTALSLLFCYDNQLTALNVSKNTALSDFDCSDNQLTALDVSKNTALTLFYCYNNQLTALDVSKNTTLTVLSCASNQLTTLDVSKNTTLEVLSCASNQLTTLDISNNPKLEDTLRNGVRDSYQQDICCYEYVTWDFWYIFAFDKTTTILLSDGSSFRDSPFVDVSLGDYFYRPVLWAIDNGITKGTDATHFSPNDTCTREQVVTFLWAAFDKQEPASLENLFSDVPNGAWYLKPVLWAKEKKITSGVGGSLFGVGQSCTRAQVVTFLWAAAGKPEPASATNPFTDVSENDYFYKAVLWAVENGITKGVTADSFAPSAVCTRAQVVTFLYKAVG